MRIEKSLPIYVRLVILGGLVFFGSLTIIASAPPPATRFIWVKPDTTRNDFTKDNYACLQETQQGVSASRYDAYGGTAKSTVITNNKLYNACMEARGWELKDENIVIREQRKQEQKKQNKEEKQSRQIGKDGQFIAYENGTVLDSGTNLMWAAKDNGSDINWSDAKNYCENYRGGGYNDWRMPTQNELATLSDMDQSRAAPCNPKSNIHIATKLIDITCYRVWASEQLSLGSKNFNYYASKAEQNVVASTHRALPVR